ncbi:MAG: succinate dehydrogenase, cytochrome b556 subunit [Proteobacteria bacterium]|nr:succinate dehydrogenase, cytochrome b556 subunit [Pseudomonadota bacterium]
MSNRPLSPHLSVYAFGYTMTTSILNRFTGVGLSVGLVLLVYWLTAVAAGPIHYARASRCLSSLPARLLYAALVVAFCYHLVAGVRHLVWDTGRGMERPQARRSAWIMGIVSVALMLLLGALLWGKWS